MQVPLPTKTSHHLPCMQQPLEIPTNSVRNSFTKAKRRQVMGLSLKALTTANPNLKMFTGMDYRTAISQMNSKMITALRRCYLAGKSGLPGDSAKWLLPCYQQGADIGSDH